MSPTKDDRLQLSVRFTHDEYVAIQLHCLKYRPRKTMQRLIHDLTMAAVQTEPPAEASAPAPAPLTDRQDRKAQLIERIKALQAQGKSLQAIANELNREGVPTISGHGQWQKGTIGNLLNRSNGQR